MKLRRRRLLALAGAALAAPAATATGTGTSRLSDPAGALDRRPRAAGGHDRHHRPPDRRNILSERLGQHFIIENRPGGGNNIGTEAVVRRSPGRLHAAADQPGQRDQRDAVTTSSTTIFLRDIAPVAGIIRVPLVMLV